MIDFAFEGTSSPLCKHLICSTQQAKTITNGGEKTFSAQTIHVLSAGGHCSTCKNHMEATFWIKYVVNVDNVDNKDKILTETQQLRSIISRLGFVFCSFLRDYVVMIYLIWKELFSSTELSIKWLKIEF